MSTENTHTETQAEADVTQDTGETSAFEQEIDDAMPDALDAIGFRDGDEGDDDDDAEEVGAAGEDGSGPEVETDADPDADDDTDDEPVDETPTIERDAAIDALIASGMKPADVMKLTEDELLTQGAAKLAELEAQGEQEQPAEEAKEEEEQPPVSEEELLEAISEELGTDFTSREREKISKGIAKAVQLARAPKFDFSPYEQKFTEGINEVKGVVALVSAMSAELQRLAVDSATTRLSEAFPQLSDSSNMSKVLERAEKYMPQCESIHDAIEMAAFTLYGREQTKKIQQHKGKVARAKQSGKPTKRASVARDTQADEITAAAALAVEKHLNM